MTTDRELEAQAYPWAYRPLPHEVRALVEHRLAELAVGVELARGGPGERAHSTMSTI
jgi:hypothetical protein